MRWRLLLLFSLSILIFVLPLPYVEITSGHEAREGIRLRAMQAASEWFFSDVLRKPPLYYWLSGLSAWVRGGHVDALSLRLPSGVFAAIGVLLVFVLGKHCTTLRSSLWASVMLITSPLYVQQSHSSRTDMLLCFFVSSSLLWFFLSYARCWRYRQKAQWRSYVFFCGLTLALLSKGPVGPILIVLPIISFLFWRHDWEGLRLVFQPGPLVTFGLLSCGWYGSFFWHAGEELWRTQIMEENISRFLGGIERMSPLYYFGPLFTGLAPWSLFLPFALWRAIKERDRAAGPFFFSLWWISTVVFFQFAAYKRAHYLLPSLPAATLLVGWWCSTHLQAVVERASGQPWWKSLLVFLTITISLAMFIGLSLLGEARVIGSDVRSWVFAALEPAIHASVEAYLVWAATQFWLGFLWVSAFSLCLFGFLWLLWKLQSERALVVLVSALILIYAGLYPSWLIVTGWSESPRAYALRIAEQLNSVNSVAFINPYDEKGVPVLFALQNEKTLVDIQWSWGAPQPSLATGYYLVTENRRKELVSGPMGVWTEVLHDASLTAWPITLFFYEAR